ncbi:MAG: hypothetical protein SGPRY_005768, partial [Prymnesium sp.]
MATLFAPHDSALPLDSPIHAELDPIHAESQSPSTHPSGASPFPALSLFPSSALLNLDSLGSALPSTHTGKPFACGVRIEVRGLTKEQAIEQGAAIVAEVDVSLRRGPVATSERELRPGARHFVMWENLGLLSLRLQPNKSNCVVWLNKAWCLRSEHDPRSEWPAMRELIGRKLPHADSWVRVLTLAREDSGIDIKDDCRLEDCSARCHQ